MRTLLLVIASLLLAGSAEAWTEGPGGTGNVKNTVEPEATIYYEFTGSTDSALADIKSRATLCFDPDIATTGTATATAYWRICTGVVANVNECEILRVDQDGDGVVDTLPLNGDDLAGRRCIYDITGRGYLDVDTASGGETARATLSGVR